MDEHAQIAPVWVGVVMRYPDGTVVSYAAAGEDLVPGECGLDAETALLEDVDWLHAAGPRLTKSIRLMLTAKRWHFWLGGFTAAQWEQPVRAIAITPRKLEGASSDD